MAGSISDVEARLDGASHPGALEDLVEGTLDVLRVVATAAGGLRVDEALNRIKILSEINYAKAVLAIIDVAISDEGHSDLEASVLGLDRVDDAVQGILGTLDP